MLNYYNDIKSIPLADEKSVMDNSVNVFSLDDDRMKILAKIISNDSGISILNSLFYIEMTANEIALKNNMSLQLVKHYLEKMQQIDIIRISKTVKNSKARDMNYYTTSKLAIIITPSKITEKTKQSKSLKRSFHSISKVFSMAIISAMTALSLVVMSAESKLLYPIKSWYLEFDLPIKISGTGIANSVDESMYLAKTKVDAVVLNPGLGSGTPYFDPYASVMNLTQTDFLITLSVIATIGALLGFHLFSEYLGTIQKDTPSNSPIRYY